MCTWAAAIQGRRAHACGRADFRLRWLQELTCRLWGVRRVVSSCCWHRQLEAAVANLNSCFSVALLLWAFGRNRQVLTLSPALYTTSHVQYRVCGYGQTCSTDMCLLYSTPGAEGHMLWPLQVALPLCCASTEGCMLSSVQADIVVLYYQFDTQGSPSFVLAPHIHTWLLLVCVMTLWFSCVWQQCHYPQGVKYHSQQRLSGSQHGSLLSVYCIYEAVFKSGAVVARCQRCNCRQSCRWHIGCRRAVGGCWLPPQPSEDCVHTHSNTLPLLQAEVPGFDGGHCAPGVMLLCWAGSMQLV